MDANQRGDDAFGAYLREDVFFPSPHLNGFMLVFVDRFSAGATFVKCLENVQPWWFYIRAQFED